MAKITEKQLSEICRGLNSGLLQDTSYGIKAERGSDGYIVSLTSRSGGGSTCIGDSGMSASEAAAMITGYSKGVEIGALAKHVYCPKCNARATLVPEDEFVKEHIFCPQCGKKSRREIVTKVEICKS